MKRILSLFLAIALAAALLVSPAAAASSAPWLQTDGFGTAAQTISVRGLSGSFDSVQITLTLDKAPTGFTFDPALSGEDVHTAYTINGNSITLYATSRNHQINQGDAILLGTLAGPAGFEVTSAADLKLLDLEEDDMREVSYRRIGVGGPITVPFDDVPEGQWFYDAVSYVYSHGLMNGTSDTTFKPGNTTTRGMIVTILYRYDGSPEAGASSFTDVAAGQYYAEPVAWAAAHNIVNGYPDNTFAPNAPITREEFAAILYRYAQYKGYDVSGRADLNAVFTDAGQVHSYARDAMAWANHVELITGVTSTTLRPGGSATRAQAATILMRFCENIAK